MRVTDGMIDRHYARVTSGDVRSPYYRESYDERMRSDFPWDDRNPSFHAAHEYSRQCIELMRAYLSDHPTARLYVSLFENDEVGVTGFDASDSDELISENLLGLMEEECSAGKCLPSGLDVFDLTRVDEDGPHLVGSVEGGGDHPWDE